MVGPALLLAAALLAYGWYLKGGPFPRRVLAERRFGRLAARSAVLFGGVSLLALALLGRLESVVSVPSEFGAVAAAAGGLAPGLGEPLALGLMAAGLVVGGALGTIVSRWRRRVFAFGDVTAVLPRDRGELGWAALVAVGSGVSEELFFRLLLPLLLAQLTGSAWIGFAGPTALFGLAHRYQGWAGVLATTLVGALMALVYLSSGKLWVAVALHMAINLNGLVLRPWAMGLARRGKSHPTRSLL